MKTTRGYGHLPLRIGLWRQPEPWAYETSRGATAADFMGISWGFTCQTREFIEVKKHSHVEAVGNNSYMITMGGNGIEATPFYSSW